MSTHTPGPWFVREGHRDWYVAPQDGGSIATMSRISSDEVIMANALLVAAAPDMLQALRDLYHEAVAAGFDCRSGYGWPTALANADKAIAKATGSAP